MKIGVPAETDPGESRVAVTPETVKKYAALGCEITVQAGAGVGSNISDQDYLDVGAKIEASADAALADADVVLKVRRPSSDELKLMKKGAIAAALMDPYDNAPEIQPFADSDVIAFAMELMPRISRAQSMDVLSSQSNLAGYKAVVDAAGEFNRAMPMMMTAAGTVPPARVFVMGAGVAGLQAIATARRMGAIVSATDVRRAAGEQVESLGATFVMVESEEDAETAGGLCQGNERRTISAARRRTDRRNAQETGHRHLHGADPGPAGAGSGEQGDGRKHEARIDHRVDLAVERGGNCPLSKPGKTVTHKGVKIMGTLNLAGLLAGNCIAALRQRTFSISSRLMIDKETSKLTIDWEDEIITGTALTRDGKIVTHPALTLKEKLIWSALTAQEAAEQARKAAEQAFQSAESAQAYADAAAAAAEVTAQAAGAGGAIDPFVFRFAIFVLAIFVGYYVVWSVTPALHTPLMSVTNAISSVIVVGALLAVGVDLVEGASPLARTLRSSWARNGIGQHFRRFPGHSAHAGHVQEERPEETAIDVPTSSPCSTSSPASCSSWRSGGCRLQKVPAGQSLRHDRHGHCHRDHPERLSSSRTDNFETWDHDCRRHWQSAAAYRRHHRAPYRR